MPANEAFQEFLGRLTVTCHGTIAGLWLRGPGCHQSHHTLPKVTHFTFSGRVFKKEVKGDVQEARNARRPLPPHAAPSCHRPLPGLHLRSRARVPQRSLVPLDTPSGGGEPGRAEGSPQGSPAGSQVVFWVIPCPNLSHFSKEAEAAEQKPPGFCPIPPARSFLRVQIPSWSRFHSLHIPLPGAGWSVATCHCFPALLKGAGTPQNSWGNLRAEGAENASG